MLTERQERILKTIVDLYIATARPVGSAALMSTSGLQVSSATIRNEMSVLEDLGYLQQPHTSSGRVPTNSGYRYYVERLMHSGRLLDGEERTIRHQFHQAHSELQEWLKLAATIMATRMHNVGLVTAPRSNDARIRHVELISIQSSVALLIVVLQDGTLLQEMVPLTEPYSQEELGVLSRELNAKLQGLATSDGAAAITAAPPADEALARVIAHLMRRSTDGSMQVIHAGLSDMMRQPEFVGPRPGEPASGPHQRLGQMVEFLQRGFAVDRIVAEMPSSVHVQVVIGGDAVTGLQDYSFVLGRYGGDKEGSGVLGVVGPTRLEYPRAIALVRYMSTLMTDLMQAY